MKRIVTAAATAALLAIAACAPMSTENKAARTADITHAVSGSKTANGTFIGKSNHTTTGHGAIFQSEGKWYVSLASDFVFDGAPDPKVALGKDGFKKEALLSKLRTNTGAQIYEIPATLNVADFNEIWIWCEQFNVPLGVAELTLT